MSRCKGCDAPIRWATSIANRRPIPLDAEPSERGNVIYIDDTDRVETLGAAAAQAARETGRILFMPHHATCPKVERFRKAGKS